MKTLKYRDAMELLGYEFEHYALEVLGYEQSARGFEQFYKEQPDVTSQLVRVIKECIEEAGSFPRHLSRECGELSPHIVRMAEDDIELRYQAEIGMCRFKAMTKTFANATDAALELIDMQVDPRYLGPPAESPGGESEKTEDKGC